VERLRKRRRVFRGSECFWYRFAVANHSPCRRSAPPQLKLVKYPPALTLDAQNKLGFRRRSTFATPSLSSSTQRLSGKACALFVLFRARETAQSRAARAAALPLVACAIASRPTTRRRRAAHSDAGRRWRRAPLQQAEGGGAAAQPPRRNRIFLFQHGAFAVANAVAYGSPTLAASPAAAPATRDKQRLGLS
jgi:hypothetical protein